MALHILPSLSGLRILLFHGVQEQSRRIGTALFLQQDYGMCQSGGPETQPRPMAVTILGTFVIITTTECNLSGTRKSQTATQAFSAHGWETNG